MTSNPNELLTNLAKESIDAEDTGELTPEHIQASREIGVRGVSISDVTINMPSLDELRGNVELTPAEIAVLNQLQIGIDQDDEMQRIETLYRRSIARKKMYRARKRKHQQISASV